MRRKQVDMQQRLWAAKLICQMFRQESCHASTVKQSEERTRREETRPEAVLDARRPVQKPSWTPGGPSRGGLGRQGACPEAVLDARRPVRRPSWTPGGPSGGRLGRQEARPQAVLGGRRPECKFYCSFAAKGGFCAGVSLGSLSAQFHKRQEASQSFSERKVPGFAQASV